MHRGHLGTVLQYLCKIAAPAVGPNRTDQELLDRFVARRDEAAFGALVERHGPMVLGVCRRVLHHHHDAEDAFQATFLVLARKAGAISKRGAVASWLYGVALRTAGKAKAAAARRRLREKRAWSMPATNPLHQLIWRDLAPVLDEEIARLPHDYQTAFVVCCLEGKTLAAAARELGWPRGTVASRLTRARERLRLQLTRRGLVLSTGLLMSLLSQKAAASVSPALIQATAQGASLFTAGKTMVAGALSFSVTALAEGVLQTMFISKLAVAGAVVLALAIVGSGTGVLAYQSLASSADGLREVQAHEQLPQTDKAKQEKEKDEKRLRELQEEVQQSRDLATKLALELRETKERLILMEKLLGRAQTEMQLLKLKYEGVKPKPKESSSGLNILQGHTGIVTSVAFSTDARLLASGSADKTVRIWDAASKRVVASLQGHDDTVTAVAFSADGKTFVSAGADKTIKVWDAATGKELRRILGHLDAVTGVALAPDGRLAASASSDRTVRLWDLVSGKEIRIVYCPEGGVRQVVFTPDGRHMAAGMQDKTVRIWEVATGREVLQLQGHADSVQAVAFAPDGKIIASGSKDKTVHLWDTATGKQLMVLKGHASGISSVLFLPDGATLVSAGDDKTVKLWDVRVGKLIITWQGHSAGITAMAASPDGRLIATASADKTIRLWEMPATDPNR
jgi:RNA polymerase sigma factor (sigma-70 family)